jgi:hypothetical protein
LASGFKRGEFIGDTNLSPTIIRCHHHHRIAHEKIGPPHIIHRVLLHTVVASPSPRSHRSIADIDFLAVVLVGGENPMSSR